LERLTHYHGHFLNGYAGDPNGFLSWRFEEQHVLGTLSDLMLHVIDMAHMLAGPITRVTSDKEIFIRRRPIPPSGSGTHYDVGSSDGPMGDVTNEDYVSALVHFANGTHGMLEACRVINGAKCDMSFEIHGTQGAIKWNNDISSNSGIDLARSLYSSGLSTSVVNEYGGNVCINAAPASCTELDEMALLFLSYA